MINIYTYIDNLKINYEVIGSGQDLILLHGWGASIKTFNNLKEELKEKYKVYLIDLPGFGDSEIGVPLGVEEIADIIYKFVVDVGIINPIILGHSYGGRIAIVYASKYSVNKLVLVSSAGIKEKLKIYKRFQIKAYKLLKKCNFKLKVGSKDFKDADNVKKVMLIKAVNQDLREYMDKICCPTILIYGKNDNTTPIRIANMIKEHIKNSYLIEIDDCGHFPYLERPNYFSLILMSFLMGDNNA